MKVIYELGNTIPSQIFAVTCLELILKSSEIETNLDLLIDIVDNFTVRLVFSWKHAFILFEECQLASLSSFSLSSTSTGGLFRFKTFRCAASKSLHALIHSI